MATLFIGFAQGNRDIAQNQWEFVGSDVGTEANVISAFRDFATRNGQLLAIFRFDDLAANNNVLSVKHFVLRIDPIVGTTVEPSTDFTTVTYTLLA